MWVYRGIGGERAVGITFECLDIAGGRWGGGREERMTDCTIHNKEHIHVHYNNYTLCI